MTRRRLFENLIGGLVVGGLNIVVGLYIALRLSDGRASGAILAGVGLVWCFIARQNYRAGVAMMQEAHIWRTRYLNLAQTPRLPVRSAPVYPEKRRRG